MKRVIACVMHEREVAEADRVLSEVVSTESYVIGDADDDGVKALRDSGLIVEEIDPTPEVATAAQVRRSLNAAKGVDRGVVSGGGPGDPPPPGVVTTWLLRLAGPLLDECRQAIDATGATIAEYVPKYAYALLATSEQATALISSTSPSSLTAP